MYTRTNLFGKSMALCLQHMSALHPKCTFSSWRVVELDRLSRSWIFVVEKKLETVAECSAWITQAFHVQTLAVLQGAESG